jgi:tetratricopeptide (TPR) repeat protein
LRTIVIVFLLLSTALTAHAGQSFYCIQILMTSNLVVADKTFDNLKGYENVRIETVNNTFAVRIGLYRDLAKADLLIKQLKKRYPDAFIKSCARNDASMVRGHIFDVGEKVEHRTVKKEKPSKPLKTDTIQSAAKAKQGKKDTAIRQPVPVPPVSKTKQESKISKAIPFNFIRSTAEAGENALKDSKANLEDDLKTGLQNFHDRKYENAISNLSRYISLSNNNDRHPAALLIIANSFEEINQIPSALKIFSRIIERYTDSPEAMFSAIALADIGVADPTLKYPLSMKGSEYLKDPALAYDRATAKAPPENILEHITYQKGLFFWKVGRYKESRAVYKAFLKEFPKTPYWKEISGMLNTGTVALINRYVDAGDYVLAADLYLKAKEEGIITLDDKEAYLKSALSFAHIGLHDVSTGMINTLKGYSKDKKSSDIDAVAAQIDSIRLSLAASQPPEGRQWALFQTGRDHLQAKKLPLAEQSMADLKNSGGDAFWAKLAEYALDDDAWNRKYQEYTARR